MVGTVAIAVQNLCQWPGQFLPLYTRGVYIVLYVDDILLLSPTVCELQNALHMCERELDAI